MDGDSAALAYRRRYTILSSALQHSNKFDFVGYEEADLQLYENLLAADSETEKLPDGATARSILDYNRTLESRDGRTFTFFVKSHDRDAYIAEISIHFPLGSNKTYLGFYVVPHERNQGMASEIVQDACAGIASKAASLGIEAIGAEVYPDNPVSRRVLEKCGFQYRGDHLSAYTRNNDGSPLSIAGKIVPDYCYPIKRDFVLARQ